MAAIAAPFASASNSVPSQGLHITKSEAAGMVWQLSLDAASGVYEISLRNKNENAEVFQDRFSEDSNYDLIPAAVTMNVRVNGKRVPADPFDLSNSYGFNPHHHSGQLLGWPNHAREICGSCTVKRSFHVRHFLDYILRRMSGFFAYLRARNGIPDRPELNSLARELNYLSDIRELEINMTCWTRIWSREDRLLRVETGWVRLPAERYNTGYRRSAASDD